MTLISKALIEGNHGSNISMDFQKYVHAIIIGGTGSGKSYAARLLLGKISIYDKNASLIICDYKGDDDFLVFSKSDNFFKYEDAALGLEKFYLKFEQRRTGIDKSRSPVYLFFDEWGAYILSQDKKKQDSQKKKIATLLLMARSFNLHIIIAVQRMNASYFSEGSRENFGIRIALGTLSNESKKMVFPDEDSSNILPKPRGKGYLSFDGTPAIPVIVPKISNQSKLNQAITDLLDREITI